MLKVLYLLQLIVYKKYTVGRCLIGDEYLIWLTALIFIVTLKLKRTVHNLQFE